MEDNKKRPLWFAFPGMGSQRVGAARDLIRIPVFAATIERAAAALRPYDVDLMWILTEASESHKNIVTSMIYIAATQVALVNVLREIGLSPDGMFGVSLGELGAAYADGTLTVEQTVLAAYWISHTLDSVKLPIGTTAMVNVSWEQCKKRCSPDVDCVGIYCEGSCIITGFDSSIMNYVKTLNSEGQLTRLVGTNRIMSHSRYMVDAAPELRRRLEEVIPNPKPRSARWISSSLSQEKWDSDLGRLSSAGYFVNTMQSSFNTLLATRVMPKNALLVEISANPKMISMMKPSLPTFVTTFKLVKEVPDDALHLVEAVEKIYAEMGHLDSCHTKANIVQALRLLPKQKMMEMNKTCLGSSVFDQTCQIQPIGPSQE